MLKTIINVIWFQLQIPHTKAQVLSRRVWDILTLLPTSPILLQGFQQLENSDNISLQQLLDPASPQKLMYSLYIVESLSRPSASNKKSKSVLGVSPEDGDILHEVPDNLRNKRARRFRKGSTDKLVIPKLNENAMAASGGKANPLSSNAVSVSHAESFSWELEPDT
ncbi:hypothetical protein C0J52_11727 [Blattella germanica]|nr:hypothetical protein C0J52_11727 [Blattella germanica]